ncbi:MAG: superoxide dismutase, partial [Planctomycetota bacterium]
MTTPISESVSPLDRRAALGALTGAVAGAALAAAPSASAQSSVQPSIVGGGLLTPEELGWNSDAGEYELPDLPYDYDELEPVIDEQTMRIHHGKHHAGYIRGLNNALAAAKRDGSALGAGAVRSLMDDITFHGSGLFNHSLFWQIMAPQNKGGGGRPDGDLAAKINENFGTFGTFQNLFGKAAKGVRGSGWSFLAYEPTAGRLIVTTLHNQEDGSIHG